MDYQLQIKFIDIFNIKNNNKFFFNIIFFLNNDYYINDEKSSYISIQLYSLEGLF